MTLPRSSQTDEGRASGGAEFAALVERHYGPLYRFALSLTRTESDASDLVQETFHVWAVKGHQLQEAARAKGWLFTTLHRLFLEGQRRVTRFPEVELDDTTGELPMIEPERVDRMDGADLVALLAQVDPVFRAPVALFYLEDCSYPEIAAMLEVPVGTVKSRIARGVAQLRELVAAQAKKGPSASVVTRSGGILSALCALWCAWCIRALRPQPAGRCA